MRARGILLAYTVGVVFVIGCRKSATPEPSPSGAAPAAESGAAAPHTAEDSQAAAGHAHPPSQAHAAPEPQAGPNLEVRVGVRDNEGGVSGQNTFGAGEEVLAAVDVSTLPAGAIVKASWSDGNGGGRGEEQKPVAAGMTWLVFTAYGSQGWSEGPYRIAVSTSTGVTASETFRVDPPRTEETTNQPG
jgi:hypothetical protein